MTDPTEKLRRAAKVLRRDHGAGDETARARVAAVLPDAGEIRHADALHVIAVETGFDSWPKLKFHRETAEMDRAARADRLKMALFHGQYWMVDVLLGADPALGRANFGLACALYDLDMVEDTLARDPAAATRIVGIRRPILHLCFSQHFKTVGTDGVLQVAKALLRAGGDVNDSYAQPHDPNSPLSALYGALGHAGNLELAEWLLEHGADPNDGESLYHATELGHRDGLRLLLKHGARPEGTNAIPRALDFNDHAAVRLLLDAGADPNEGIVEHPGAEPSFVIPALHQAARRMCDGEMVSLLLKAGADPSKPYRGLSPYSMARVYGNRVAADLIAAAGGDTTLTREEKLMAAAADGADDSGGQYIDPAKLPSEYRNLIRTILHLPGRLEHVKRLVALGLEYDHPDPMGLPPVQIAGWEGLPEMMAFLLSLRPDLSHINGYGGTLLSTVIHGSEFCPSRHERDHIECARLALVQGMALPRRAIDLAGDADMAAFLADWAQSHPGQVVDETVS